MTNKKTGKGLLCQQMVDWEMAGNRWTEIFSWGHVYPLVGAAIAHGKVLPVTLVNETVTIEANEYILFGVHSVNCRFNKSSFVSADLRGTSFVGCVFVDVDFDDADLSGAYIHACEFQRCSFTNVRWTGAEMSRCWAVNCKDWPNGPDSYRNDASRVEGA